MDTQNQIHQHLKKNTLDFEPDADDQICRFIQNLNKAIILNGLDAYCFSCSSGSFFKLFNAEGVSLSLIHPLPFSKMALCLSLVRVTSQSQNAFKVKAGVFNITRTAGDPIDLSAVRMEKVILDVEAGETPDWIRRHGMYRNYRKFFEKTFTEKRKSGFLKFLNRFFPKSKNRKITEQIIFDLKNLEVLILQHIENPDSNKIHSRHAFNY